MREAARALDDVSDHLGEVLRRADELLAEWSRFGAQVRTQVDREVATIGEVVDGAVARVAGSGIDRALVDRLRALHVELERLEQRTRAASRAVVEQRDADRRILWIVVAGVVLANALLVALLLRKPDAAPVAEPIRIEAPTTPPAEPAPSTAPAPSAPDATSGAAAATPASGSGAPSAVPSAGSGAPSAGSNAPAAAVTPAAAPANAANAATAPPAGPPSGAPAKQAKPPAEPAGATKPTLSPIALPPKAGGRPHKKLP